MSKTVVFIHGGWVTPACWGPFVSYFAAKGYRCLAPAWPGKDRPVEAIRADPSPLAGVGIDAIVDHYAGIIRELDEPPILVGHSFGGLFVQLLVDRGLGAAGIAIDSAPPKGIFAFAPTTLLSLGRILAIPFGWRKVVHWSYPEYRFAFVHTMAPEQQRQIWDAQIVPTQGGRSSRPAIRSWTREAPHGSTSRTPTGRRSCSSVAKRTGRWRRPRFAGCTAPTRHRLPGRTSCRSPGGRTGSSPRTGGRKSRAAAKAGSIR